MGDICLDDLEHTRVRHVWSVRRDEIFVVDLHLEEMPKGGLEADVVERSDFLPISHFSSVQNCPLGQLGNAVRPLLVLLVLLHSHLPTAFEREEEALGCLQADRGPECHGLLRVPVFELEQCEFFAFAHLKIRDLNPLSLISTPAKSLEIAARAARNLRIKSGGVPWQWLCTLGGPLSHSCRSVCFSEQSARLSVGLIHLLSARTSDALVPPFLWILFQI